MVKAEKKSTFLRVDGYLERIANSIGYVGITYLNDVLRSSNSQFAQNYCNEAIGKINGLESGIRDVIHSVDDPKLITSNSDFKIIDDMCGSLVDFFESLDVSSLVRGNIDKDELFEENENAKEILKRANEHWQKTLNQDILGEFEIFE